MVDDLVKLARYHVLQIEAWGPSMEPDADLVEKLADRIEKLEAALARIAKHDLQAIAMDALRPGERIRTDAK